MCGFAGEIRFDGRSVTAEVLARMVDSMSRRGPDAAGLFLQDRVGLGHRRLKIIDLSDSAQQPMVDSGLGLAIVYNGAIYNYRELRDELSAAGYAFFSSGDTEVILKAYHRWGSACVERLSGMFAFAIWERDSGQLFMARDRLGIKPLYFSASDGAFRFASSLPALLRAGDVDTSVDPIALHHYMTFHSVVPAPRTILSGIRKLSPGTTMTVDRDGSRQERVYWSLSYGPNDDEADFAEADWQAAVLDGVRTAVKRRLVADVAVGVLLSGGLDSSLVTALLAAEGQSGLKTFSIGFETVNDEAGDEFKYSDIIVDRFATDHEKIFIDSNRALDALPRCVEAMSEPMVSHDAIGFYLLSEQVSKHVRVVQSGQGADEIFAGYHWYPPLMNSDDGAGDYAGVFFDRDNDEFRRAVTAEYANGNASMEFVEDHFAKSGATRPIDKALRLDTTVMLVDDPVKRVDNMTMAWGLEARVPFLDHELVELAARVPAELKVKDGGKHILKEAARSVVPREVIDRPKGYFPVPALKYLRGPYLDLVRDALGGAAAERRGIFDRAYVDTLLQDPEGHITPLRGSKLWQVALLEIWLQQQGIAP